MERVAHRSVCVLPQGPPRIDLSRAAVIEDLQTSYDPKLGGIAHRPDGSSRRRLPPSNNGTTTTELLGRMIGWMSGDERPVSAWQFGGVSGPRTLDFAHVLPLVEHIDCFTELCVLQRYA